MKLLFTKSPLPLSVFIRWGLNQQASHFAILFADNLVFQSNLLGTGIEYGPDFLKAETVVASIDVPLSKDVEDKIYDTIMPKYSGHAYDYGAFMWDCWRQFLKVVFRVPIPDKNAWAKPDTYLCVGLVKALDTDGVPDDIRAAVRAIPDAESMFPWDLYQYLVTALAAAKAAIPIAPGK